MVGTGEGANSCGRWCVRHRGSNVSRKSARGARLHGVFQVFSVVDGTVLNKKIESDLFQNISYKVIIKTSEGKEKADEG